jgi:enoyl-CoA hydratase
MTDECDPDDVLLNVRDRIATVTLKTGADPAFCAGLDLKELGSSGGNLGGGSGTDGRRNRDG